MYQNWSYLHFAPSLLLPDSKNLSTPHSFDCSIFFPLPIFHILLLNFATNSKIFFLPLYLCFCSFCAEFSSVGCCLPDWPTLCCNLKILFVRVFGKFFCVLLLCLLWLLAEIIHSSLWFDNFLIETLTTPKFAERKNMKFSQPAVLDSSPTSGLYLERKFEIPCCGAWGKDSDDPSWAL